MMLMSRFDFRVAGTSNMKQRMTSLHGTEYHFKVVSLLERNNLSTKALSLSSNIKRALPTTYC